MNEFCALYSIGRTKAYELFRAGLVATVKIGRARRVDVLSAEAWANGLSARAPLGAVPAVPADRCC